MARLPIKGLANQSTAIEPRASYTRSCQKPTQRAAKALAQSGALAYRQSDRLKCFAGGLIKFYKCLPCHEEPIIRLVLPVDSTNIWPLGVDPALF